MSTTLALPLTMSMAMASLARPASTTPCTCWASMSAKLLPPPLLPASAVKSVCGLAAWLISRLALP